MPKNTSPHRFGSAGPMLLTQRQAAELLGIPPEALRRMATRGAVPSFKVGSRRIYRRSDLDSWISSEKRPRRWTRWVEALKRYLSRF
jgi:excisionase family DNA binding protein